MATPPLLISRISPSSVPCTNVWLFDAVLIYTLVYEKAFGIPAQVENVKTLLKLQGIKYGNRAQRKLLSRRVDSIPAMGVKVGEFHVLERTSTPEFLDYVLSNIVNMLVAYG